MNIDKRIADRWWRMNHLYKIKDKDGNIVTFKMNKVQKHFDKNRARRNVMCKSRQHGVSTYKIIDALDKALFSGKAIKDCVIIAQNKDVAKMLFVNKLRFAWEQLPQEIRSLYILGTDSATGMQFNLGTNDKPFINSVSIAVTARAGTTHYAHITELSSVDQDSPDKAIELMSGTVPSVPDDGDLDIESTPKGNTGQFHDIFMNAWNEALAHPDKKYFPREYKPFFYNWQWDTYEMSKITPDKIEHALAHLPHEMKEYKKEHKLSDKEITFYYFTWLSLNKNWDLIRQEYPTTVEEAFRAGSESLFDLSKLAEQVTKTPRRSGNWSFYKEPRAKHVYAMGCDVSEGIGKDASTAVIYDFTDHLFGGTEKPEVVATYKTDDIDPTNFAREIASIGRMFNDCLIAVERNNHGHATLGKLAEIYPQKMIFSTEDDRLGWISTSRTKPLVLYGLQDALINDDVNLSSAELISEMSSFPKDKASQLKPKTGDTNHWDLLIAGAIGYHMKNYIQRPRKPKINTKKAERYSVY